MVEHRTVNPEFVGSSPTSSAKRGRKKMVQDNGGCSIEMPRYTCHKKVHALKIKGIVRDSEEAQKENRETDGSAIINPEGDAYGPFVVDAAYLKKHDPQVGGYYVVYDGGYKSFSPAEAFESGYTLIS